MQRGTVIGAEDHGTIWRLTYRVDGNGLSAVIFDHRPFAQFYETATDSSFFDDYAFGHGRDYVARRLNGLRIAVDGDAFCETVRLED